MLLLLIMQQVLHCTTHVSQDMSAWWLYSSKQLRVVTCNSHIATGQCKGPLLCGDTRYEVQKGATGHSGGFCHRVGRCTLCTNSGSAVAVAVKCTNLFSTLMEPKSTYHHSLLRSVAQSLGNVLPGSSFATEAQHRSGQDLDFGLFFLQDDSLMIDSFQLSAINLSARLVCTQATQKGPWPLTKANSLLVINRGCQQ